MLCSLATKLDQKQLDEIGTLEKDLGVPVLAFACHQAEPAAIGDDKVAKIKELESKLGVSLVAVSG
jgi:50S ribosomal subunit-associated GTPase HflX